MANDIFASPWNTTCPACGEAFAAEGHWALDGVLTHERCADWSRHAFPYRGRVDVIRRLARHADPGRAQDVLRAAAAMQALADGWPAEPLWRLERAKLIMSYVRRWTTSAPDKLRSSL